MYRLRCGRGGVIALAILASVLLGVVTGGMLLAGPAQAEVAPSVYLDDHEIPGVQAVFGAEGRLIVPMRPFFEGLGASVYWDGESRTARAFMRDHVVTLQADNQTGFRDGEPVRLYVPATILNGRMFIPLRFAAESLGGQVHWDGGRQTARITFPDMAIQVPAAATDKAAAEAQVEDDGAVLARYPGEEIDLLMRVINAEAYKEPYEGKVAVGAVIVNRARQSGQTLTQVLRDRTPSGGCHFTVVCNGQVNRLPVQDDVRRAAAAALRGEDPTGGALYFNATRYARGRFWDGLRAKGWRETRIGNQSFFRPPAS